MVTIPLIAGGDIILELPKLSSNAVPLSVLTCGRASRSRVRGVLFRDWGVRVTTLPLP